MSSDEESENHREYKIYEKGKGDQEDGITMGTPSESQNRGAHDGWSRGLIVELSTPVDDYSS